MVTAVSSAHSLSAIVRQIVKAAGLLLLGLLMLAGSVWGVMAVHYWDHADPTLRNALAAVWAVVAVGLIVGFALRRWRWRSCGAFAALFALLLSAWGTLEPSNDRDCRTENALLAYATIDGDRITLHNIRNFDYRTETDFTPGYYDRTFDLNQLDSVDMFTVYWMGPAIAHVFVSFGFKDGAHVAFSIETRREKGQAYSSVAGFFRQYTLYYAVGDERDIVRVRTNYRHDLPERVYLYRLRGSEAAARKLFLGYLEHINELKKKAEWYN